MFLSLSSFIRLVPMRFDLVNVFFNIFNKLVLNCKLEKFQLGKRGAKTKRRVATVGNNNVLAVIFVHALERIKAVLSKFGQVHIVGLVETNDEAGVRISHFHSLLWKEIGRRPCQVSKGNGAFAINNGNNVTIQKFARKETFQILGVDAF